jgi:hypothetical protein
MGRRWMAIAAVVAFGAAGCMQGTTEIAVKKDGSGTISETVYLSKATLEMVKAMAQMSGGDAAASDPLKVDEEKCRAKAPTMGEGVTFVSAKAVKNEKGDEGTETVFAFADVSKLRLDLNEAGAGPGPSCPPTEPAEGKKLPLTFAFAKGDPSRLTIRLPKPAPKAEAKDGAKGGKPEVREPTEQEVAMAKQMGGGLKMHFRVAVEGTITKTNAAYVNQAKNGITIFRLDFEKTFADAESTKKLMRQSQQVQQAGGKPDFNGMRGDLQGVAGCEFELAETVEVEFK